MSKKGKIEVGTLEIDHGKAMRIISRGVFGNRPTTRVPDKKRQLAHSRHEKHRRPYSE